MFESCRKMLNNPIFSKTILLKCLLLLKRPILAVSAWVEFLEFIDFLQKSFITLTQLQYGEISL